MSYPTTEQVGSFVPSNSSTPISGLGFWPSLAVIFASCAAVVAGALLLIEWAERRGRKEALGLVMRALVVVAFDSEAHGGEECPICLVPFESRVEMRAFRACRHCFHADCIEQWMSRCRRCPSCRAAP